MPWSVSWTAVDTVNLHPSSDFLGFLDLLQAERAGLDTPRFAALHATRQRRGMIDQLCHVCGRRTLAGDRYVFPVESGGFVAVGEAMRHAGTVPAVRRACGQRASALCPQLSHALANPVRYPSEGSQVVPRPDIPEGMAALARSFPHGQKIVFACLRIYGPRFSRAVETIRKARGGRAADTCREFTA